MAEKTKPSPTQVEAEGPETVEVEWRGHRWSIAASIDDMSAEALLALEEGKAATACREVLGRAAFTKLLAEEKPKGSDLGELLKAILAAMGADLGE